MNIIFCTIVPLEHGKNRENRNVYSKYWTLFERVSPPVLQEFFFIKGTVALFSLKYIYIYIYIYMLLRLKVIDLISVLKEFKLHFFSMSCKYIIAIEMQMHNLEFNFK